LARGNSWRCRFCSSCAPSDESVTAGSGHGVGSEGLAAQSGEVRAARCRSRGQGSGGGFIGARHGSSCRERHGRQRQGGAGLRRVPAEHEAGGSTGSDGPRRAGRAGLGRASRGLSLGGPVGWSEVAERANGRSQGWFARLRRMG
jgi:hypothetical protein